VFVGEGELHWSLGQLLVAEGASVKLPTTTLLRRWTAAQNGDDLATRKGEEAMRSVRNH
jgi:hypothetical protein